MDLTGVVVYTCAVPFERRGKYMTNLVYTAYPEADLREIADTLNGRRGSKDDVLHRFGLPDEGSRRHLKVPQLWRVLQAVFTGADTPDNDKLIAAIDGVEYLDGWSDMGAAYIGAADTADIARVLAQVDFDSRWQVFAQSLKQSAEGVSESDLAAFDEAFRLQGSEEFEACDAPERVAEMRDWFGKLCAFYRDAAAEGCGVIVSFAAHV